MTPERLQTIRDTDAVRVAYVYVVEADKWVKIGMSNVPEDRLRALKPGIPFPAKLVHKVPFLNSTLARAAERGVHRALRHRHANGEWFLATGLEAIAAVSEVTGEFFVRRGGRFALAIKHGAGAQNLLSDRRRVRGESTVKH